MSNYIEIIHSKILQKNHAITSSIHNLDLICNGVDDATYVNNLTKIQKKFNDVQDEYNLSTMSILTELSLCDAVPQSLITEFTKIVSSNNYIASINEISNSIKVLIGVIFPQYQYIVNAQTRGAAATSPNRKGVTRSIKQKPQKRDLNTDVKRTIEEIFRQLSIADSLTFQQQLCRSDYEICDCGEKMIVAPSSSELLCPNDECGEIRILHGTVFEDHQFYNQDGQKTKHGSYTHMRHLKFWIERIQARENKEFSRIQHEKINHCITRDGILTNEIDCMVMRGYFKECDITALNNHAPLMVRIKTGKVPPQLTYDEINELSIKFSKMMELYDKLNPEETFDRQNKPYYPYFIYKILEYMFVKNQKIKILECIHLQSRETVIENDLIYEKICDLSDLSDKFIFKPTDRCEYL